MRPVTFEIVEGLGKAGPHLAVDGGNGERWLTSEPYTDHAAADRSRIDVRARLLETLLTEIGVPEHTVAMLLGKLHALDDPEA